MNESLCHECVRLRYKQGKLSYKIGREKIGTDGVRTDEGFLELRCADELAAIAVTTAGDYYPADQDKGECDSDQRPVGGIGI